MKLVDIADQLFQSTLPSQGATEIKRQQIIATEISIHAPLTGSDVDILFNTGRLKIFQSTLPSQGATG